MTLAYRYRLLSPLLAIEKLEDRRSLLCVLNPGTDFIVLSATDSRNGMVEIEAGERRLEVFQADLDDRAIPITADEPYPLDNGNDELS